MRGEGSFNSQGLVACNRGGEIQARHVADYRLRLVQHEFSAVSLGQCGATQHAGDAAHLDDVRLSIGTPARIRSATAAGV